MGVSRAPAPDAPSTYTLRCTVRKLALRLVINAVALWAAASLVDGLHLSADFVEVLVVAIVFGLVNAVIKPVLLLLSLPFLILSLGLLTFVINALMLTLAAALTAGLVVDGFYDALLGSIVVSIVSLILSHFLHD